MLKVALPERLNHTAVLTVHDDNSELLALGSVTLGRPGAWEEGEIFSQPWQFFFDRVDSTLYADLIDEDENDNGFLCLDWASREVCESVYAEFRALFPNAAWEV